MLYRTKDTKYNIQPKDHLTTHEKELVSQFINTFDKPDYRISPFELRLPSAGIRAFLLNSDSSISFISFNRLTRCLGRTSKNHYAYSLVILHSLAVPGPRSKVKFSRSFPVNKIRTISFYGTKRTWAEEYQLLMRYAHSLGCTSFADCFGGSGFLSLLASRLNLFEKVFLNEGSTSIYNFHCVMQSDVHFRQFEELISITPQLNQESFYILRDNFYSTRTTTSNTKSFEGREERRQLQTIDVNKAVSLYAIKHYAYNCQGGFTKTKIPLSSHVEALRKTHRLYQSIELSNYYYRKFLVSHLNEKECFIILDPPYLKEFRVQKQSYELEFTDRQHRSMLQLLSKEDYPAKVVLCGYKEKENDLYSRYLQRAPVPWHCIQFKRAGQSKKNTMSKEYIWCNFNVKAVCFKYPSFFEFVF
ncbi:MAG: hypothetical protein LBS02_03920 [Hungatella sp.]|jgi:hypothetical protein|nr:hypothetical protein [Hungatella sp.]